MCFSNCAGGHETVGEAQQVLVLSHQIILGYGQDKLESLRKNNKSRGFQIPLLGPSAQF